MNHAARLIFTMTLRQVPWLYKNEEMDTEFSKYTCLGTCVYSQVQGKKDSNNFFKYFSNLWLGSFEEDLCEIQWWAGDLTWETGLEVLFDTIPGKAKQRSTLPTPVRNQRRTKVRMLPKFNLANQWIVLGLLTGVWMNGYRSRSDSPKPTPAWVTVHESGNPGIHCTVCRQLKLESISFRQLSGLSLFRTVQLISVSSRKLGWSVSSR